MARSLALLGALLAVPAVAAAAAAAKPPTPTASGIVKVSKRRIEVDNHWKVKQKGKNFVIVSKKKRKKNDEVEHYGYTCTCQDESCVAAQDTCNIDADDDGKGASCKGSCPDAQTCVLESISGPATPSDPGEIQGVE